METIYGILEGCSTSSLTFPSTETERDIENIRNKEARVKLVLIVTNESHHHQNTTWGNISSNSPPKVLFLPIFLMCFERPLLVPLGLLTWTEAQFNLALNL